MGVEFRALWGKLRSVRGDVGHGGGGEVGAWRGEMGPGGGDPGHGGWIQVFEEKMGVWREDLGA